MTENRLLDADPTFESAVARLTKPWTDVLTPRETGLNTYTPVDHPSLLSMLDDVCRSSYGAGASGAASDPASRNLLNLEALNVREHIDGTVRAWIGQLSRQRPEPELRAAVLQFVGILQAHHAARTITDREYERLTAHFPRWCDRIWRLYDPPVVKELIGACPNPDCEQTQWDDGTGQIGTALIAFTVKGSGDVRAKCRCCTWEWSDLGELAILGRHLGATQDEEVLRAAGIM